MNTVDKAAFAMSFDRWFKGNMHAVQACLDLMDVIHLWDDLVDADKPFNNPDQAMRKAMIDLPSNPFWQANAVSIQPLLQSAYLQWQAANVMEKTKDAHDLHISFVLRASVYQVIHFVAALCGGVEWAVEIGPEVYRLYGESFDDFRREMLNA